jgi:hypothetical protein
VSRSTAATKNVGDGVKVPFQAEPLRVTDPRSDQFVQPAETFPAGAPACSRLTAFEIPTLWKYPVRKAG